MFAAQNSPKLLNSPKNLDCKQLTSFILYFLGPFGYHKAMQPLGMSCDIGLTGFASQFCSSQLGVGGLGHDTISKVLRTKAGSIRVSFVIIFITVAAQYIFVE